MSDPPPIDKPCEGSLGPPTALHSGLGMCAICGAWLTRRDDGSVRQHDRRDILAMLARGDFG